MNLPYTIQKTANMPFSVFIFLFSVYVFILALLVADRRQRFFHLKHWPRIGANQLENDFVLEKQIFMRKRMYISFFLFFFFLI